MIKNIFDEIASESSTKNKLQILTGHKAGAHSALLSKTLYMAKSGRVKFHQKQIPSYTTNGQNVSLEIALSKLSKLQDRSISGDAAVNYLSEVLSSVSPDDAYIIERVIDKNPKIGMGRTQINKAYLDLIEKTFYMGAKSYKKKLVLDIFADPINQGYAYSQVKMDGRYLNSVINNNIVELESRSGETQHLQGAQFVKELAQFKDCVLNGELTVDGIENFHPDGATLTNGAKRSIGNGMITSLISIGDKILEGTDVSKEKAKFLTERFISYQDALDSIRLTVWDTISIDEYDQGLSKVPYHDRLVNLSKLLKEAGIDKTSKISFVKTRKVYKPSQAMDHFVELLEEGLEGTILKASMGIWKDGKPNWQVKMKLEMEVELEAISFNYGKKGTKNEHVISSINCKSSCGQLITRAHGMKESMMQYITDHQDELKGKIFTVKCNGTTKKNSNGFFSMNYPAFSEMERRQNCCR